VWQLVLAATCVAASPTLWLCAAVRAAWRAHATPTAQRRNKEPSPPSAGSDANDDAGGAASRLMEWMCTAHDRAERSAAYSRIHAGGGVRDTHGSARAFAGHLVVHALTHTETADSSAPAGMLHRVPCERAVAHAAAAGAELLAGRRPGDAALQESARILCSAAQSC
jgi:hypothetical protein